MSASGKEPGAYTQRKAFLREVRKRRERRERSEREGDASFWSVVGTMGMVGWTVALPTAAGVLLGRWLDGTLEAGHVFMVFFMIVGLALGCIVAWRMIAERV